MKCSSKSFGHVDEVARNFWVRVDWDGRGVRFHVTQVLVKRRKWCARADHAQINGGATVFAEKLLGGFHKFAAQAGTLPLRVHGQQSNVAAISTKLDVNAARKTAGILREEKFSFFHVGEDSGRASAVAIENGALDDECGVDKTSDTFGVVRQSNADSQALAAMV